MTSLAQTVTIGLDPHPNSHTATALDENGLVLDSITVKNSQRDLKSLRKWAEQFPSRRWAIEGVGNPYIRPFVDKLLQDGERVYAITPNLTSQYRNRGNQQKDDQRDAANAARALLANPQLPPYMPSDCQYQAQELSRQQQRLSQQLRSNKMAYQQSQDKALKKTLQGVINSLEQALAAVERQMKALVKEAAPSLLALRGVGPIVATILLAEVGLPERFASPDAFAFYAACAPTSYSSGRSRRVMVNYKNNRRLNYAVHVVAMARVRTEERTQAFMARKKEEGKTARKAWRALKTYIARELFGKMKLLKLSPLVESYPDRA